MSTQVYTAPYTSKAFTANGTATGFVTVDNNSAFQPGAIVYLRSATVAAAEYIVVDLSGTTLIGVRLRSTSGYGRSDVSAYTTANSATITMPSQPIYGQQSETVTREVVTVQEALELLVKSPDASKTMTLTVGDDGEIMMSATGSASKGFVLRLTTNLTSGDAFKLLDNTSTELISVSSAGLLRVGGGTFIDSGSISVLTVQSPNSDSALILKSRSSSNNRPITLGNTTDLSATKDLLVAYRNAAMSDEIWRVDHRGRFIFPTGANAVQGTATLSSGTVTVSTTAVKTGSKIFVSLNTPGGTLGTHYKAQTSSIVDGTSFIIVSVNTSGTTVTTDTSTINWWIQS